MTRLIYGIFVFLLIFSPLALGTVETWSFFIMETLAILAFLLFVLGDRNKTFYEIPGLLPLVLFLAYMLFQIVPLPAGWVRAISSSTYAVYEQTIGQAEPVTWMTLSMNRKATASEFFRMAAYSCFYILTVQLLSDQKLLKRTVSIVIGYAAILAFLVLVLKLFETIGFFGFRKIAVWENHLDGFLLMTYPLALGLFFYYIEEI
jgi:hypothetical protein